MFSCHCLPMAETPCFIVESTRTILAAFAFMFLMLAPSLHSAVLFEEKFSTATDGQAWDGYGGWTGATDTTIKWVDGQMMGTSGIGLGTMRINFPDSYFISDSGYRLSFDVVGPLNRPFLVILADTTNNRAGMQLGATASGSMAIGGVSVASRKPHSDRVAYNPNTGYDGYYGTTNPPGFSTTSLYQVFIDVNGTSVALMIGNSLLEAGKMRVTYNSREIEGMATYTTTFDIPEIFTDLFALEIAKVVGGGAIWSVGNFELTSVPVPKPSAPTPLGMGVPIRFLDRGTIQ